jgi:hypothetical protein
MGRRAKSAGHRAQSTEHRGRRLTLTDDTDSKIYTDLKAPLGGFGGKKEGAVRSGEPCALCGGTFGDPLAPVLQIENNYHAAHGFFVFMSLF